MGKWLTPATPPPNRFVCRRLRIPATADFLSLVMGALASLAYEKNFEAFGDMSPEDTAQVFKRMLLEVEKEADCMVGEIRAFLRDELPIGVLLCDGSTHLREDYPKLYEVIPDSYKIDSDSFTVPNLIKRGLVGWDDAEEPGEYEVGAVLGQPEVELTEAQLAPHSHTSPAHGHSDLGHQHTYNNSAGITIPVVTPGEAVALTPNFFPGLTNVGNASITETSVTIEETGEGAAIDIRNPDLVVLWGIVAL